jgi:hypothetical protein
MKWEYKVLPVRHRDVPERLAELGAEGWELLTVLDWTDGTVMFYFKRPSGEVKASAL